MPDKEKFVNELFRVAQPGGRIIIVTWTHRDLEEGETSLTKKEEKLLAAIVSCFSRGLIVDSNANSRNNLTLSNLPYLVVRTQNRAYYLPRWCSGKDYIDLLTAKGATDIKREDWSYIIAPFWKAVIKSSFNFKSIWGLLRSGFSTQRGAYAMFLMLRGYKKGLIKVCSLSGESDHW